MSDTAGGKMVDSIQQYLTAYASNFEFSGIDPPAVHAAKVRIIDNLGALVGGYSGEPCEIARKVAAEIPYPGGATVLGTKIKVAPEMAALANATAARYAEMTDSYHWPGSAYGHPGDVVTPVLAAAEYAGASGKDLIAAVVLAYEVYLRFSNVFHNRGYDHTNFCCLGTAVAAAKLLRLSPEQLAHCIAMAAVPNVILRQVRTEPLSMWKAVASGYAGRAGVFAAILARAGMEGPNFPFEGKAGWCDQVARERFTLETMGGKGISFKVLDTQIKPRAASGDVQAAIMAAEKLWPLKSENVDKVIAEVYKITKERAGSGEVHWHPSSREEADHSLPYAVAVALIDGTVTLRSFDDAHLRNPQIRALMQKVGVIENRDFTEAYERWPVEHRTRITVLTQTGEKLVGETGGDEDDLSMPKSDEEIAKKFRGLTEEHMNTQRADAIMDRLWYLEDLATVAALPPLFILD